MTTPQFINVGAGESMPITALSPTGDDVDGVEIQTLTAYGYTDKFYTWNTWMYETPCWVDENLEAVEDVSFDPGAGLWVQGASTEQSLQSAGKVGTDDVVVTLRFGATATGNPYPVSLDINDILPEGDDVDGVEIQTLTAYGYTDKFYTWNTWMYETPCWVDENLEAVENVSFGPGAGLWVQGASTSQSLRFPAPEL